MSRLTQASDLENLSILGQKTNKPERNLETFPNHHPERDYTVTLNTDEFTTICPATGQPDFARLTIRYVPDERIVESKSVKLYLWTFRDEGTFMEHVTNVILDDFVKALQPRHCVVIADFAVRGGIGIKVHAEYIMADYIPRLETGTQE